MSKRSDLEDLIRHHKIMYYKGRPEISDDEFDSLEEKLRKLDPNNSVLQSVGTSYLGGEKVKHDKKMLSLNKAYTIDELLTWAKERELVGTYKIDGVSCSLIYKDGKLDVAKTRGNGTVGENITDKALWIDSIPKGIDDSEECEVRGELFCKAHDFKTLVEEMESMGLEKPTSMRNIVAGLIGRKENIELCRYITFMGFDFIGDRDHISQEYDKTTYLQKLKFKTPLVTIHNSKEDIEQKIDDTKSFMVTGDYQIDGIVFSLNDLSLHDSLGETAHHPRYKMAFKFKGESKETVIQKIEWSVSRNGILTPIALVEPVELGGAEISRVTLHNYGMVKQHRLKSGDTIEIIRSGEVIPKFLSVVSSSNKRFSIPRKCPVCSSTVEEEDIRLFCSNENCFGRIRESILNFVRKIGMDDISTKRLDEMLNSDLIESIPDLYKLSKEDFLKLDKVKDKLAGKFVDTIEKSKDADLVTFLSALGISGGAYNKCEKIVRSGVDTLDKILGLSVEKLGEIESFAEKSAGEFIKSLKSKKEIIEQLRNHGFKFEQQSHKKSAITGKKVCITGTLSSKRSDIEEQIRQFGGIVVSSVTKNTDFLLTNDTTTGSTKLEKAKKLGITIISEQKLLSLIGKN